mmetsp:Transcript_5815/g.8728  ORF Transcript_5815/g.8728 Transcript_5815/m.8728 type:complete len:81 (-) Transcript_5815:1488-1730(-)
MLKLGKVRATICHRKIDTVDKSVRDNIFEGEVVNQMMEEIPAHGKTTGSIFIAGKIILKLDGLLWVRGDGSMVCRGIKLL